MNRSYRGGRGGFYTSAELKEWKLLAASMMAHLAPAPDGLIKAELDFSFQSRASDIDGRIKATLDAISAALRFNDNRIMELLATKAVNPRYQGVLWRLYSEEVS